MSDKAPEVNIVSAPSKENGNKLIYTIGDVEYIASNVQERDYKKISKWIEKGWNYNVIRELKKSGYNTKKHDKIKENIVPKEEVSNRLKELRESLDKPNIKEASMNNIANELIKIAKDLIYEDFVVNRFPFSLGNRSKEVKKEVFLPFIKKIDNEMKKLKGKWNGQNGYSFKTKEKAEIAQNVMNKLTEEYNNILVAFPENRDFNEAKMIEEYFKNLEK